MPDPVWLRQAGHGLSVDGQRAWWSVAEGSRGRRWREVREVAGVTLGILLELDPLGRWSRLEMTSASGLLTLHPEWAEDAVHGNVATADGLRHVAMEWSSRHRLLVPGSIAALAALARSLETTCRVGESAVVPGLAVDPYLHIDPVMIRVSRRAHDTWILGVVGAEPEIVRLEPDGWPVVPDASTWALELDGPSFPS
jgi:hypothetical protein